MLDSLVRVSRRVGWVTDKTPKPSTTRDTTYTNINEPGPETGTKPRQRKCQQSQARGGHSFHHSKGDRTGHPSETPIAEATGHQLEANATPSLPLARSPRNAPINAETTQSPV